MNRREILRIAAPLGVRLGATLAAGAVWIGLEQLGRPLWSPVGGGLLLAILAGTIYLRQRLPRDAVAALLALAGGMAALALPDPRYAGIAGAAAFLAAATLLNWEIVYLVLG